MFSLPPGAEFMYKGKWLGIANTPGSDTELVLRTTDDRYFAGVNIFPVQILGPRVARLHLIENFRIPIFKKVLEAPAGLAEKGSSIEQNAMRELQEEIGVGIIYVV